MPNSQRLRVLILEDRQSDCDLLVDELCQGDFELDWHWVQTETDYLANLDDGFDLILADYSLPQFSAPEALRWLQRRELDIPFIVVTGTVSEEAVVECMKQGAADYLLKDRLTRLRPAVAQALQAQRLRGEKRQAEEALLQSEERFSKAFHASPAGIFITRFSDGLIVDANESFMNLTGYSRDELIGHSIIDLDLWSDEATQNVLPAALREHGSVRDREAILRTKAESFRHTLASAELIELSGEECVLALIFDVTDRDRATQERLNAEVLRVQLAKEHELLELKERFLSKLSHDFRTPLAVIQASSDLLSQYFDRLSPEKRLKYAQELQTQIKVMTDMMEEALIINRAQSGKLHVSPALLDLVSFCQTLFEDMQLIDTAQHEFIFATDGRFENVKLDEKLLRHILVNLLTNATKYSPDGGIIRFELLARDEHVIFRISDQGIGIPEEDQQRLFEEFYRARNTGQISGTGLGLSIVKRSVEAHGGTMEVDSKLGVGTTFTVHLPANFESGQP